MDNSRRDFLKRLGLGGLGVVAATNPIIGQIIVDNNITTEEQLLNKEITIFRYKVFNGEHTNENWFGKSFPYYTRQEAELGFLFSVGESRAFSNGEFDVVKTLNHLVWKIQNDFEKPTVENCIIEEKMTIKQFLELQEMKIDGLIKSKQYGYYFSDFVKLTQEERNQKDLAS